MRNEKAEDFFALLKEWNALCKKYIIQKGITSESEVAQSLTDDEDEPLSEDTYEVEKLLDICFGDPNSTGQVGLWFKVLKTSFYNIHVVAFKLQSPFFYICLVFNILYSYLKHLFKIVMTYRCDGKDMI